VDFQIKTVLVGKSEVKLQIWDTAGQDRFSSVTQTYFRGSNGAALIFDLTDKHSLENCPKWIDQLNRRTSDVETFRILIGNKADLTDARAVSREDAESFAREHDLAYMETSAKDNTNVDEMFNMMAEEMQKRAPTLDLDFPPPPAELPRGKRVGGSPRCIC
jgi:small GTP-binding protein